MVFAPTITAINKATVKYGVRSPRFVFHFLDQRGPIVRAWGRGQSLKQLPQKLQLLLGAAPSLGVEPVGQAFAHIPQSTQTSLSLRIPTKRKCDVKDMSAPKGQKIRQKKRLTKREPRIMITTRAYRGQAEREG